MCAGLCTHVMLFACSQPMYAETVGQGCSPDLFPTLEHSRFRASTRNPGAAFPECVQGGAAKGSSESLGIRSTTPRSSCVSSTARWGLGQGCVLGGATLEPAPSPQTLAPSPLECQRLLPGVVLLPPLLPGPWSQRPTFQVRGDGQREVLGEGESRPSGGRGARAPLRYALAGAVTTDGVECLPPRGV